MPMISTSFAIAIGLCLLGVGLMLWAYLNPKWQRADAYDQRECRADALIPFSLGVMLFLAGLIATVVGVVQAVFGAWA